MDFLLNHQPDALIIQMYSVIKLHVSSIFSAHHQEFSTVHSELVSLMQVSDDRFQAESGWNCIAMRKAVVWSFSGSNPHSNGDLFSCYSLIFFEINVVNILISDDNRMVTIPVVIIIIIVYLFFTNILIGSQVYFPCIR